MHRYLPLALIASTLTVFAEPPVAAHPVATSDRPDATAAATSPAVEIPAKGKAKKPAKGGAPSAESCDTDAGELRAAIDQLKLEKEHLTEQLALEELKRKTADLKQFFAFEARRAKLEQESLIAKTEAEKISNEFKVRQVEWLMESSRMEAEIKTLETEALRASYTDQAPEYLLNPLQKDGSLVISDRRISLNGPIVAETADHVTTRINFFNNKDPKLPIFIVIDDSPGGSVMSGYRILKSMEGSKAPVYVVVKSFAASMAATIATLAEHSFAYPNAVILHHQMSSRIMFANLNITQQKELVAESQRWWERLAGPIAQKMGVTTEEFIERMYARSSSGDWTEFADEAQRLKWINNVVTSIHETSLVRNPDAKSANAAQPAASVHGLTEELNEEGRPVMYLPHSNPRDYYFIYNPDGYYQLR